MILDWLHRLWLARWRVIAVAIVLLPPAQWCFGLLPFPSPYVFFLVAPGIESKATVEARMLGWIRSATAGMTHEQRVAYLERRGLKCQTRQITYCVHDQLLLPLITRGTNVYFDADPSNGVKGVNVAYTGP